MGAASGRLLQTCGIMRILGTQGLRCVIPQWTHASWSAAHWKLGGVTSTEVSFVCHSFGTTSPVVREIQARGGRDTSTVLCLKLLHASIDLLHQLRRCLLWAASNWAPQGPPFTMVVGCSQRGVINELSCLLRVCTRPKAPGPKETSRLMNC